MNGFRKKKQAGQAGRALADIKNEKIKAAMKD